MVDDATLRMRAHTGHNTETVASRNIPQIEKIELSVGQTHKDLPQVNWTKSWKMALLYAHCNLPPRTKKNMNLGVGALNDDGPLLGEVRIALHYIHHHYNHLLDFLHLPE